MRVLTFAMLSGLMLMGLTVNQGVISRSAELSPASSDHHFVGQGGNRRERTYRGSGRREILASPTPLNLVEQG
ncbi:hypothetical protein H6G00_31250 [Leptolyngbya sp. FACHB-541]|uniref:hypothetical protein n=1 Tax=Leptolyngbya sp. FACHB-541 TaxID=2692810 RepID=UPI001684E1C1|nr:hypothetical protein [Leptolyngbya sp. FACHB-541]MBD2001023.1 hypothetical protein [Leptolyngbya sp. FACHB-541]